MDDVLSRSGLRDMKSCRRSERLIPGLSVSVMIHLLIVLLIAFSMTTPLFDVAEGDSIHVSLVAGMPGEGSAPRPASAPAAPAPKQAASPRELNQEQPQPADAGKKDEARPVQLASLDVYTNGHAGGMHLGEVTFADGANSSAAPMTDNGPGGAGSTSAPRYSRYPRPVYPPVARARGYEGRVVISAEVKADGTVGSISVKQSSGYRVLDESASAAIRKWRFEPARKFGIPVAMWVDVPVRFALHEQY